MDKNSLIGFTLIGLVLIGFSIINRPTEEERARIKQYQDSIQYVEQQKTALEAAGLAEAQQARMALPDSTSALFSASQGKEIFVTLKNNLVELELSTKGGFVNKATLADYKGRDGGPIVLFDGDDEMRMNFAFSGKNENILTENLYFQPLNVSDSTVTMRLSVGEGRHIDFNYFLQSDLYLANLIITSEGMQNFFTPSTKTMDVNWYQKTRQQEKGFSFEQQFSSLTYRLTDDDTEHLNERAEDKEEAEGAVNWIAFKNQFFSSVIIASEDFNNTSLKSVPLKEGSGYLKKYNATSEAFFDPTGRESTHFQLYFGPNHFKTLQATNDYIYGEDKDPELEGLVYLGWPIIRWINRWFTINVFDWLSGWGLNMGIVILLMTIIVKIVVYPTTYKSYMSSAKMRVLRPYIDEINKKYPNPDDAMKKNQETMALYSRYGVSPMGGCLPMLIQMPVYIALFNFVPNAIELRGQSFLWANDLSTYDDVINWGTDIWLLGDHLSLFCLLFSVTNILNTWYTMRQQKETMAQQQMPGMKIMMYAMPVMFIFFFNSYSAGLNFYYFISGLIGILIMIVLRKTTDDKALLAKLEARMEANKNKPRKMTGMAAKLEALQKQLEEQQRLQQQGQNNRR
ncbi:MAG: membrane protein insertase YidC [Bacteroidaceae bacterium]|nr:membrane protein insertase YidC [Bacteroidaceae bacterium]